MDDGGALADDNAVCRCHDHEMAWQGEVGGEPVSPYRFVEDVLGDLHHKGVIAGKQSSDFHLYCVKPLKSTL